MLKCYDCMEDNTDAEAVSVCIACGKGLCMEHTHRLDVPIWEGSYPMPVKVMDKSLPRIMCEYCRYKTLDTGFD